MRYNSFIVVKFFELVEWKVLCKLLIKIINLEELALDWVHESETREKSKGKMSGSHRTAPFVCTVTALLVSISCLRNGPK